MAPWDENSGFEKLGKKVQDIFHVAGPFGIMMRYQLSLPVIKAPALITKYNVESLIPGTRKMRDELAAGGARRSQARAQMFMAYGLLSIGLTMWMLGELNGDDMTTKESDESPEKESKQRITSSDITRTKDQRRRRWAASKNGVVPPRNSVRIGDYWVQIDRQPGAGNWLIVGANIGEMLTEARTEEEVEGVLAYIAAAGAGLGILMGDQTFARGIKESAEMISNLGTEGGWERYIEHTGRMHSNPLTPNVRFFRELLNGVDHQYYTKGAPGFFRIHRQPPDIKEGDKQILWEGGDETANSQTAYLEKVWHRIVREVPGLDRSSILALDINGNTVNKKAWAEGKDPIFRTLTGSMLAWAIEDASNSNDPVSKEWERLNWLPTFPRDFIQDERYGKVDLTTEEAFKYHALYAKTRREMEVKHVIQDTEFWNHPTITDEDRIEKFIAIDSAAKEIAKKEFMDDWLLRYRTLKVEQNKLRTQAIIENQENTLLRDNPPAGATR